MGQSLTKIYVHIVFHVKNNKLLIREKEMDELYAYMGAIIKDYDSIPIVINGVGNHVHILCVQSKNIALAKLVERIKSGSSKWIKTKDEYYRSFKWQGGYGAFSVSQSIHDVTKRYIENQKAHHAKGSFKDEYLELLKKYKVEYNEKYLWD